MDVTSAMSGATGMGRLNFTIHICLLWMGATGFIWWPTPSVAAPQLSNRDPVSFRRTFGGPGIDEGNAVLQTSDGGYIITGVTASFGTGARNLWLLKVDATGRQQWSRSFGSSEYSGGESLQETVDGGYIIVGSRLTARPTDYDILLIKTDGSGRELWTRTFGGRGWDWGNFVRQTPDGGYIITGWTDSYGAGGGDLWLIKTDAAGAKEWDRTYGGIDNDQGNCVQATTDGGYIVTGATTSYSIGQDDLWVIKTDAAGSVQWTRTFGGGGYDEGQYVQQTVDGGYIVLGSTTSFGSGDSDVWFIRLTVDGEVAWTRTLGGPEWDWGSAIKQVGGDGFIMAGSTFSNGAGESDIWLIRTHADGSEAWSRTFGGPNLDFGLALQPTADGGFVIAGQTHSYGAGKSDLWLIKTDAEGQVVDQVNMD